jgi:aconitase B
VALFALALAGACLGFLPWNFHPARVFMGTAGAAVLGYGLATFSILAPAKVATALLILGLPILECPEAVEHAEKGDVLKVDLAAGTIFNETTGQTYQAKPFPEAVMNIIRAGGLMASIKEEVLAREAEYAKAGAD